jgi:hypothetical protein
MICQPGEFCHSSPFCTRSKGRPSAALQADIQFRTAASGRAAWPIGHLADSRGLSWNSAACDSAWTDLQIVSSSSALIDRTLLKEIKKSNVRRYPNFEGPKSAGLQDRRKMLGSREQARRLYYGSVFDAKRRIPGPCRPISTLSAASCALNFYPATLLLADTFAPIISFSNNLGVVHQTGTGTPDTENDLIHDWLCSDVLGGPGAEDFQPASVYDNASALLAKSPSTRLFERWRGGDHWRANPLMYSGQLMVLPGGRSGFGHSRKPGHSLEASCDNQVPLQIHHAVGRIHPALGRGDFRSLVDCFWRECHRYGPLRDFLTDADTPGGYLSPLLSATLVTRRTWRKASSTV